MTKRMMLAKSNWVCFGHFTILKISKFWMSRIGTNSFIIADVIELARGSPTSRRVSCARWSSIRKHV